MRARGYVFLAVLFVLFLSTISITLIYNGLIRESEQIRRLWKQTVAEHNLQSGIAYHRAAPDFTGEIILNQGSFTISAPGRVILIQGRYLDCSRSSNQVSGFHTP